MALKTWQKFLEGKGCDSHTLKAAAALEKEEEKQGKDLDNDEEEGEEEGHAEKVVDKAPPMFSKKSKK